MLHGVLVLASYPSSRPAKHMLPDDLGTTDPPSPHHQQCRIISPTRLRLAQVTMEEYTPGVFADRNDPTPPSRGRQTASTDDSSSSRPGRSVSSVRQSMQDRLLTKYVLKTPALSCHMSWLT